MREIRPVHTVYFHRDDWQTPGKATDINQVFGLLKMDNIAVHEGYDVISPATVVDHEPDLIIADSIESVVENPSLSGLHMVSDTAHIPHHIFELKEDHSFDRDDPRFQYTVEAFAAFAYPDTFPAPETSSDGHGAAAEEGEEEEEAGHGHSHSHSHSNGHGH
ncbi:MAG: hypothetical protein OXI91_13595 [Chloroflexota bacterium]|nr:hypothetical protein [Chloroflexota bacterium]